MPMPWNFDSEVFESQIDIELPPELCRADVEETEIETPKNVQSKTKKVVQALETLKRIAEMNGPSDNSTRSQHEFETVCLKQRKEASRQSNIQDFF